MVMVPEVLDALWVQPTVVVASELLLVEPGSDVDVDTVAVLVTVEPGGVPAPTCSTKVKVADAPAGSVVVVQVKVPPPKLQLNVSSNTVKTHVRCIYRKLGVQSRAEAVDRALSEGLLAYGPANESRRSA